MQQLAFMKLYILSYNQLLCCKCIKQYRDFSGQSVSEGFCYKLIDSAKCVYNENCNGTIIRRRFFGVDNLEVILRQKLYHSFIIVFFYVKYKLQDKT